MNVLNWVQQREDYHVKYHVLEWKTSHFHEPFSKRMVGSAQMKQGGMPAASAQEAQKEGEGMAFAPAGRSGNGRLGLGLGLEGSLPGNSSGGAEGRDGVSISARGVAGQQNMGGTVQAAQQGMALAQTHAAENTITPDIKNGPEKGRHERERTQKENTTVAQPGRGNIRNRLRESAARLREAYQRQKEKAAKSALRQIRKEAPEKKEKKGTRQVADRETVLSMQAENHYLLDSYDAKGNYSMLGKQ